jgi:hypothetical protein
LIVANDSGFSDVYAIVENDLPVELRSLVDLWRTKRGSRSLPARRDFPIEDLKPWLGRMHVVEVLPGDFRFAIFATTSAQRMGFELTGKLLSEAPVPDMVKEAEETYRQSVNTKRPVYRRTPPTVYDDRLYGFTRVVLPLGEQDEPDRLFVAIHYDLIE